MTTASLPESVSELPDLDEAAKLLNAPRISEEQAATWFAQPPRSTVAMALYEYACTSLSPFMFDRMTQRQINGLVTGDKVEYPKDETLEVKAYRKMYSDKYVDDMPAGNLGIPNENFCACLRDTGKKVKYGQGTWDFITSASNGTLLYCMIRLVEPFIILRDLKGNIITREHIQVDCRKGTANQGSGAVGIIRPRLNECGFAGHVLLGVSGEYVLPEKQLEKLINMAGLRAGLCSARPGMQMPFGQFVLRHLKWIGGAEPRKTTVAINDEAKPKRGKKAAEPEANGDSAEAKPKRGRKPKAETNGDSKLPEKLEDLENPSANGESHAPESDAAAESEEGQE